MRRPRLTKKVAKWLIEGACYLSGDADFIEEIEEEDQERREGLYAVCTYMSDLARWHEAKQGRR